MVKRPNRKDKVTKLVIIVMTCWSWLCKWHSTEHGQKTPKLCEKTRKRSLPLSLAHRNATRQNTRIPKVFFPTWKGGNCLLSRLQDFELHHQMPALMASFFAVANSCQLVENTQDKLNIATTGIKAEVQTHASMNEHLQRVSVPHYYQANGSCLKMHEHPLSARLGDGPVEWCQVPATLKANPPALHIPSTIHQNLYPHIPSLGSHLAKIENTCERGEPFCPVAKDA